MADDADLAAEHVEREAPYLLRASRKPVGPQPNGRCHWCDEVIDDDLRFCGPLCRDDWEKRK